MFLATKGSMHQGDHNSEPATTPAAGFAAELIQPVLSDQSTFLPPSAASTWAGTRIQGQASRTLRQSATVCQEKPGMERACLMQ